MNDATRSVLEHRAAALVATIMDCDPTMPQEFWAEQLFGHAQTQAMVHYCPSLREVVAVYTEAAFEAGAFSDEQGFAVCFLIEEFLTWRTA